MMDGSAPITETTYVDGNRATQSVHDMFWAGRLESLCQLAALSMKYAERNLTPSDISALEGAKHYIEIALRNDANNKAENAA